MKRNKRVVEMKGLVFGKLTVWNYHGIINHRAYWNCYCLCGKMKVADGGELRTGKLKSCGCGQNPIRHGFAGTKFYNIWSAMKARCFVKKNKRYKCYGGRGITVSPEWLIFENFKKDMYEAYVEHKKLNKSTSIDRINNDGNYEFNNCRWATNEIQQKNK
jgi:hypothetical protein